MAGDLWTILLCGIIFSFSSVCAFERVLVIAKEVRLNVYSSQISNEESSIDQGDCTVRKKNPHQKRNERSNNKKTDNKHRDMFFAVFNPFISFIFLYHSL